MERRNIIVIGASAGGFDAIKAIVAALPAQFPASVFIVWHMAPDVTGMLPRVLNKIGPVEATNASDNEPIIDDRIYVAPPDHHLLIEPGRVRVTHGPKENRFRPAIDPLFRSAAKAYGQRVIGIILSGALDDGTAGLWAVKRAGGIAIVQDPDEAEVSSMPESALRSVKVDYKLSLSEIPGILQKLVAEDVQENPVTGFNNERLDLEVNIAMNKGDSRDFTLQGDLTPYTCPECHGVVFSVKEADRIRFRCHTGHAFSSDALLAAASENIEASLWAAIRGLHECIALLNHIGDQFAEDNDPKTAALYFKKANDALRRSELVRKAVVDHEHLSISSINEEAKLA